MIYDPKPLPPGRYRMVCSCVCGRKIPDKELIEMLRHKACPECGKTMRHYEPYPVGWVTRLRYWWNLRQWKRRQTC